MGSSIALRRSTDHARALAHDPAGAEACLVKWSASLVHNSVIQAWARAGNTRKAVHWPGTALEVGVNIPATCFGGVMRRS